MIALVQVEEGLDRVELFDVLDDLFDEGPFFLMNNEVGGERGAREMWVLIGGGVDDSVNFRPADVPITREPNALGSFGKSEVEVDEMSAGLSGEIGRSEGGVVLVNPLVPWEFVV